MDLLYIEYIKHLISEERIECLVVFPTVDLTASVQSAADIEAEGTSKKSSPFLTLLMPFLPRFIVWLLSVLGIFRGRLEKDFEEFEANLRNLFRDVKLESDRNKLKVITPSKDNFFQRSDLDLPKFIKALRFVGSQECLHYLQRCNLDIESIPKWLIRRSGDDVIKDIFLHAYKSWSIAMYIEKNRKKESGNFLFLM